MKKIILFLIALVLPLLPMQAQDSMGKAKALFEKATKTNSMADYNNAITALKVAVNEGFGEAAYILGTLYFCGYETTTKKVDSDLAKACSMYEKSVELGQDDGLFDLGRIYLYGWGNVEKNPEKAFKYFLAASEKHLESANYYLALCYWLGVGVEENEGKALEIVRENYDQMGKFYDDQVKDVVVWFLVQEKYKKYFYNEYYRPKSWSDVASLGNEDPNEFNMKAAYCIMCRKGTLDDLMTALTGMYQNNWPIVEADIGKECGNKYKAEFNYQEIGEAVLSMKGLTDYVYGWAAYFLVHFRNKYKKNETQLNLKYLNFAVEKGNPLAMKMLADWYEKGYNVSKNLIKAKTLREKGEAIEQAEREANE